jgi:hypothetical protein
MRPSAPVDAARCPGGGARGMNERSELPERLSSANRRAWAGLNDTEAADRAPAVAPARSVFSGRGRLGQLADGQYVVVVERTALRIAEWSEVLCDPVRIRQRLEHE